VLAIANGIDRLGGQHQAGEGFNFFRKTSAELCAATLRQHDGDDVILRRYLAQIGDARLHRALAAALDVQLRKPDLAGKRLRANQDL
jgi:hypothetical protein